MYIIHGNNTDNAIWIPLLYDTIRHGTIRYPTATIPLRIMRTILHEVYITLLACGDGEHPAGPRCCSSCSCCRLWLLAWPAAIDQDFSVGRRKKTSLHFFCFKRIASHRSAGQGTGAAKCDTGYRYTHTRTQTHT